MAGIISGLTGKGTHSSSGAGYDPVGSILPLRESPEAPDRFDPDRIEAYLRDYNRQTDTLLVADRQIEYNIRMLCNQQWNFYNWASGQYLDISEWFTPEEQRWRQLPTVNEELSWYVNTHSRLTENPPILTWLPGPDRTDSELAEILDALVKLDWRRSGMETLHTEAMMWLVSSGRGHLVTYLDPSKGEWRPWIGRAQLPLWDGHSMDEQGAPAPVLGPDGNPVLSQQEYPEVPIRPDGSPNAVLPPNGEPLVVGKGHMERSGGIGMYVPSPLQVRGEWGPQLWHQKRWHAVQTFQTPEQVWERFQVEVEPDVNAEGAANVAILERVLYGAGFYGTARGLVGGSGYPGADVKGPLCTVIERWDAPLAFDERLLGTALEGMMETPDTPGDGMNPPQLGNPGGRHIVFTPNAVISDGPREVRWPYTSPVRCFDFIRLPGRPRGVTPLEILHSTQRYLNKILHVTQEGINLNAAPQRVVWEGYGIQADEIDNAPNRTYTATGEPTDKPPIMFLNPPPMNADVWRIISLCRDILRDLGGQKGTEGQPPTDDPSGELIKELRFNADRDLGDTARRNAAEYGRLGMDWKAIYPLIYNLPQVISATGQENAARTIMVYPELFIEGQVHVQADAESMLPEGRGERQARAYRLWKDGAFGDPRDPTQWAKATRTFLDLSRFPSYSALAKPGGIDRVTAEKENAQFLMGAPGMPVLPWYDDMVHLETHEELMKSVDWLKQPQPVKDAMVFHRTQHILSLQKKMMEAAPPPDRAGGNGNAPQGKGSDQESRPADGSATAAQPKSRGGEHGRAPLAQ